MVEALMEERCQHIATYGVVTRTVNQAYFAFCGSAWTHLAGERCGNAREPTSLGIGGGWLGTEESNPHIQIQNLLSYH